MGGDKHCLRYRVYPLEAWGLDAFVLEHRVPSESARADKGDVAERALQRAIEEYRLQRPELVRTEFHSRSLEGIAGQLEQETAGY